MGWIDRLWRHWARKRLYERRSQLCHVRLMAVPVDQIRQWIEEIPQRIPPYEAFSAVWSQYSGDFVPNYLPYIAFLAHRRHLDRDVILDLACGSGRITEQLLSRFGHVHCLDRSPAMLTRLRSDFAKVRGHLTIHQADFRDFTLPVAVPFVVCAGDSLNYVESPDELAQVFRCVAACLRPGGFFLFDVIQEPTVRVPPTHAAVFEIAGHLFGPYWVCTWMDSDGRTEHSFVVTKDSVEEHRRILIKLEEVAIAAEAAGLELEDQFGNARLYCILRKKGE